MPANYRKLTTGRSCSRLWPPHRPRNALPFSQYVGYPTYPVRLISELPPGLLRRLPVTKKKAIRVLVADDNPTMRRIICAFLKKLQNVEVCAEATDGTMAVEKARNLKPNLLILDVVMPGLSGIEAAALIKKFLPHAKVIVFTLYDDKIGNTLANFSGVDVLIPKTAGLDALSNKINSLLAETA